MKKQTLLVILLSALCLTLAACGLKHKVELGPETLSRVDEINRQLERGLEVGPETRALIEELNQTIDNGLKVGFDEDTLKRIDRLLERIEKEIVIKGELGPETIETLNRLIDEIDAAPEKWEDVTMEIIRTLEGSTEEVAKQMASEIEMLMHEARINSQQIIATSGIEFRCNADFLENKIEVKAQELIGRGLIYLLKAIIAGEDTEPVVPIPWVCQIIPDQIDLVEVGEALVAEENAQVIRITGYNFVPGNLPEAYVEHGAGENRQRIDSIRLYPRRTTPYQIMLNLQEIDDFGTVPAGSWLVFRWPDGRDHSIPVLLERLAPELEIIEDEVSVYKGPDIHYHLEPWRVQKGAKFEVLGQYGTWWKIRDNQRPTQEGWVQDEAVLRNEVPAPKFPAPLLPPEATFECSPRQGYNEPLSVRCTATKTAGDPSGWEWTWDFGDGSGTESGNPVTHDFHQAGVFEIQLAFENRDGWGTTSSPADYITVDEIPPPPEALFTASSQTVEVDEGVRFTNYSRGDWEYLEWDFGDRDTSSERYRVDHTFDSPGTYEVKLTLRDRFEQESRSTVTIIVVPQAKVYPNAMVFYRYSGLSSKYFDAAPGDELEKIRYNIGVNDQDFKCGIVGFRVQGVLPDPRRGTGISADVADIEAYMETDASGDWWINASLEVKYETRSDQYQSWDIDTLCIGNGVFARGGAIYMPFNIELSGGNVRDDLWYSEKKQAYTADTGVPVDEYHCGIVGFSFKDAIYTPNPPYVFKAFAEEGNGNWIIQMNFQDLSLDLLPEDRTEWIRADVMCLTKDPDVDIRFKQARLPSEESGYYFYSRDIGLTDEIYRCGIFGISATGGGLSTVDEKYREIMRVQVGTSNTGLWVVWGQIPSVSQPYTEDWLLDLFCLNKEYVVWDIPFDCSNGACSYNP